MADPERGLSVAEAAAALKIGRTTARRLFDASQGAAGERGATGERYFAAAWVAAEAVRRADRPAPSVSGELSVAEAAARLGISKNSVRRWFDRDQPGSGRVVEGGRTGGTERRCAAGWVQGVEQALRRPPAPPQ